jgi:serine/threonine-protein kinase
MSRPALSPERRRQIETLFEAALDLEPEDRPAYLARACDGDPALHAEVAALLDAHDRSEGILESDPKQFVAGDPVALAPGDRIGAYQIVRELGRGGMAAVYLAEDGRHERRLALKLLHPGLAALLGHERFRREIRLAARLHHPHILPLHDSGESGTQLWYTMPFVDGESLRERLRRDGRLPLSEALRMACEVADALDYAHRQGVIHRDVKPENLLLTRDGDVLVADFGIGRVFDASAPDATLTRTGVMIGTPAYMSPEQARGTTGLDGRTDVYGLGCVLYEMLAGEPPYPATTAQRAIYGHINERVPDVRRFRPDAPPRVSAALRRALAKTPGERFSTAREFADALQQAGGSTARRKGAFAALGLLSCVALGGAFLWEQRGEPAAPAPAAPPVERSIAVLPLTNLSGDTADQYLSAGIAEELTDLLAAVPGLRVAARHSAAAMAARRELDAREMANRLGVGHLLEGTVRRAGDSLRLGMSLVSAKSGLTLWSDSYTGSAGEILQLEDEIARRVAGSLQTSRPPPARRTAVRAHDDYRRGRYALNGYSEADLRQAIDLFERAIAADSGFAPAWSGLAAAWTLLADDYVPPSEAYPRAKAAALHALRLDSTLADAHAALGGVLLWHDWDFPAAGRALERAIALDPNASLAFYYYGHLLGAVGRLDSALAVAQRAALLDPMSGAMVENVGYLLELRGEAARAAELCDPDRYAGSAREVVVLCRARAYLAEGRAADALLLLDRHPGVRADHAERTRFGAYQALGRTAEARAVLAALEARARTRYVKPEIVAQLHAALGEREAAFRWLRRARDAHAGGMIFLSTSRWWDPIRDDPRFRAMLERMGLPAEGPLLPEAVPR